MSMVGFTCIPTRLLTPMHFKNHQNNRMDAKSDVYLYTNHFFITRVFKNFRSYRTEGNNQYTDSSCHKPSRDNSMKSKPHKDKFFGALAKLRKVIIGFVMFVRQSTPLFFLVEQLFFYWTELYEIRYLSIFRKYF